MPLGVPLSWMAFLYDHPPLFVDAAEGAHFTDVDGHRYLDMSLGITVASTGHTAEPVVRAVTERMAKGIQFHLQPRTRPSSRRSLLVAGDFRSGSTS